MAKCTVVSTLPFVLEEYKHGLTPHLYVIPAATKEIPGSIVVEDGFHLVHIPLSDEKQPPMRVVDTAEAIAKGLVLDYITASIFTDMQTRANGAYAIPGLFWVEGAFKPEQIKQQHADKLKSATNNTLAWFERLVKVADDDWERHRQLKMITDIQRAACRYIGLEREWNQDLLAQTSNITCWACQASLHPNSIICRGCNAIINRTEYDKRKADFVLAKGA